MGVTCTASGLKQLILLADTNIIIDLAQVDSLNLLPSIAPTEILDIVLQECYHPKQPDLIHAIRKSNIQVVESDIKWGEDIENIKIQSNYALSFVDSGNLYYAREQSRTLLTGDKALRDMCQRHNVDYHGSIWLLEQAHRNQYLPPMELCQWIQIWMRTGRYLPKKELLALQKMLGC